MTAVKDARMCRDAKNYSIQCPLLSEFESLGIRKWMIPIIFEFNKNEKMRFSAIKKALKPITSKVLSKRLKELEGSGLLHKIADAESLNYVLTDKGRDFMPYLVSLRDFSLKWSGSKSCLMLKNKQN
jgi:DNA-binding HxlR family transcriptional regulator